MSYGRETLTDIWEKISERDTNKNIEIKEIVGKNNDGYYDVLMDFEFKGKSEIIRHSGLDKEATKNEIIVTLESGGYFL